MFTPEADRGKVAALSEPARAEVSTLSEPMRGTFVGRDLELRQLRDGLDAVADGRGRCFLIAGEPGIGKSRLVDELGILARQRQHPVLLGRGWEDAGAPPYWPWVQALRAYLRLTDVDALARELGSGASDVAQILPELRETFPDLPPPPDTRSESARFQLFDSTATFLRNATQGRPIVIVLEDLHAADTPSLLLLRFVASQLADMGLLLLATFRDVALVPDHPLTLAVSELKREPVAQLIALGGLPVGDARTLIGDATGVEPSEQLAAAVWRETGGNPLFIAEAMRLLGGAGKYPDASDPGALRIALPAGVREAIGRRIDGLGQEASALVRIGAALGPEFRVDVLRRVAGLSGDATFNLLDQAMREGLVLGVSGSLARYRFSHDLVREALYQAMPASQRVGLHRQILEVLEQQTADAPDQRLAELAHHASEAARAGAPADGASGQAPVTARAIDYARRAGDRAARSVAYEEAARLYRMALGVLDTVEPADEKLRAEILLSLGQANARAGDLVGSRAVFLEASEIAKRLGLATHLARAALGIGGRLPWARPGRDTLLIPLLQDALVMLGGGDVRLRVRLLARLACAWRSSPERREESAALSHQAVDLARGTGDLATLSYALGGGYWARWWPENSEERLAIAEEMLDVAERLGDAERLIDAHLMLFMTFAELNRMTDARAKLEDVSRLANDLRQPSQLWLGIAPRTLMALFDGDFDRAERALSRELEQTVAITLAADERSAAAFHVFLLRREQGRPSDAEPVTRRASEDFPWYPLHRAALACLLTGLGRLPEARALVEDLAADRFRVLARDNEWLLGASLTAEACHMVNDAEEAGVLYEQLAPFAGRHAIGQAEGSIGIVDRYLGLLCMTMGRLGEAERHLRAAVEANERLGSPPWAAHSRHDLARALVRAGQTSEADIQLREARAAADRLGMVALAAQIEALASDSAIATAGSADGAPRRGTFRREGDYWAVAFDGSEAMVRDGKGMHHLARLLAVPGRELHALDLAQGRAEGDAASARSRAGDDALAADPFAGAGPLLDAEAKTAYRARLNELDREIAAADEWNDPERAARARHEREQIVAELAGALGLGGRDRAGASGAERARVSVTRAIRLAMARLDSQAPQLGRHLSATVRTGTYCSYQPEPDINPEWEL